MKGITTALSMLVLGGLALGSCASAGDFSADAQVKDGQSPQRDGPTEKDAASPPQDAGIADAPISQMDASVDPDAGNPLVCTNNDQCTTEGTCCFFAELGGLGVCTQGVVIGVCVPI